MNARQFIEQLRAASLRPTRDEKALQRRLWAVLEPMGLLREEEIAPGHRPDFVTSDKRLVVEVKTRGSTGEVNRQLLRYVLEAPATQEIVLITTCSHHLACEFSLRRKGQEIPVSIVHITGL